MSHAWFKWLQDNGLSFIICLPKHHYLTPARLAFFPNGRKEYTNATLLTATLLFARVSTAPTPKP